MLHVADERVQVVVVGAGASGLASARAMSDIGRDVLVLESEPGLGGVWAETRQYPGLATQNTKASYSFSDLLMPASWPEQPGAEQMREYLARYTARHGLDRMIRYRHVVRRISREGDRWTLEVDSPDGPLRLDAEAVVLASGVLSNPHVPQWPGLDAFGRAGGRVLLPPQFTEDVARGRRVVVVGWGKTACDLAVAVEPLAASTTVVARSLRWKTPHRLAGLPLHELLMLSRTGEWLLYGRDPVLPRSLHRVIRVPPRLIRTAVASFISRRLALGPMGMVPSGQLSNASSQVTHGLYEAIRDGRITVHRDVAVDGLEDGPAVRLSDGRRIPADLVLLGTGHRLRLDLLEPALRERLAGADGVLALRRFVQPEGLPGLYLVGWTQNISGLLTAEVLALWAAAHLQGRLPDSARSVGAARAEPASVPGSSLADLDRLLGDLGHPLPAKIRAAQWVGTMKAEHYASTLAAIRADQRAAAGTEARRGLPAAGR